MTIQPEYQYEHFMDNDNDDNDDNGTADVFIDTLHSLREKV